MILYKAKKCSCGNELKKHKISNRDLVFYCPAFCENSYFFVCCTHNNNFIIVKHNKGVRKQCSDCGELFGNWISKNDVDYSSLMSSIVLEHKFDVTNYDHVREKFKAKFEEKSKENNSHKITKNNEAYTKYINSDAWKQKRYLILKRDDYICQSCLKNKATDVHHLTYDRIGFETAYDLISVCRECHELIHKDNIYAPFNNFAEWAEFNL